jgi:putative N6-adenine-specific DNA methylase
MGKYNNHQLKNLKLEKTNTTMIAKTLSGLENVLAAELSGLGAENVKAQKRAVSFDGDTAIMYKANLWCRTALSILKPVFEFTFEGQQQYYDVLRNYHWDELFGVEKTIAINAMAFHSEFTNSHFLAQRTKDAVVDYFMDKTGKRPSVDIDDPQIKLNIFIHQDRCSVSLDSSGAPLFKRGYRRKNVAAPLNEVLGAGLVMLSGWDKQQPFYDPMCGSATFSIEAGMLALNMAPSIFRRHFSFQHWGEYNATVWEAIRQEARDLEHKTAPEILAADISNSSMDAARQNLMEAGLLGRVKLEKRDFFQSKPRHDKGVVIINPPYGMRLQNENIKEYYQKMGATLKHNYSGFKACIISPDKLLTHQIGLRHTSQQMVFNGQIECRFLEYQLYEGTRKIHKRPRK